MSARGPGRSGIDFGRKVNPTSVATAREAARYLDPTNESTYMHAHMYVQRSRGPRTVRQFTAGQRYLPSWPRTGGGKFGNKICSRQLDLGPLPKAAINSLSRIFDLLPSPDPPPDPPWMDAFQYPAGIALRALRRSSRSKTKYGTASRSIPEN